MQRIKSTLPEAYAAGSHYNETDMKRRLAGYRKANNSQVAEPPLKLLFDQQGVQLHQELDCTRTQADQVLKSLKIYIERFEKPFNYMTYDEEAEKVHVDQ
jgi:hypothetical protein